MATGSIHGMSVTNMKWCRDVLLGCNGWRHPIIVEIQRDVNKQKPSIILAYDVTKNGICLDLHYVKYLWKY